MCIYSPPGTKVRISGKNGHDYQQEHARKVLSVGSVYEVVETKVGRCSSGVALVGFERMFNTVMFERA
jgi:hypothetical protein